MIRPREVSTILVVFRTKVAFFYFCALLIATSKRPLTALEDMCIKRRVCATKRCTAVESSCYVVRPRFDVM